MMMLVLVGALAGAVLGLRYRVFVLFPVIGIACVLIAGTHLAGFTTGYPSLAMMLVALALQFGYLVGISGRVLMVAARAANRRTFRGPALNRPSVRA
jgi:hypothetical protein